MPGTYSSPIDALAAPADDGGLLIWPDPDALLAAAARHAPVRRARRLDVERGMLFEDHSGRTSRAAPEQSRESAGLVIMSGHQPEFLHPGVWAKAVFAEYLARRVNGQAPFLIVDCDASNGVPLAWPGAAAASRGISTAVAYPERATHPFEGLPDAASRWSALFNQVARSLNADSDAGDSGGQPAPHVAEPSGGAPRPPDPSIFRAFANGFLSPPSERTHFAGSDYVHRWCAGMNAIATSIGMCPFRFRRISGLFNGDATPPEWDAGASPLALAACLLLSADRFHDAYNAALVGYRAARGIRGDRHPLPDLARDGGRLELPLWLWRPGEARRRLYVSQSPGGGVRVWADDLAVGEWTRRSLIESPARALIDGLGAWRIRPRALVLTLYLRVFACDLFIHGLGGAKYDQITDDLIGRFFGIEPPPLACVTATLRLPLTTANSTAGGSIHDARRHMRDLRCNPQRHLVGHDHRGLAELLADRAEAVAESDRLRAARASDRRARRTAYERIHRASRAILDARPQLWADAQRALHIAEQESEALRLAGRRDWFIGLYSADRLHALNAAISRAAGGS